MLKTSFLVTLLLVFIFVCSYVQSFPLGVPEYEVYEPEPSVLDFPNVKRHLKEPYANLQKMNAGHMFRALINLRKYK